MEKKTVSEYGSNQIEISLLSHFVFHKPDPAMECPGVMTISHSSST